MTISLGGRGSIRIGNGLIYLKRSTLMMKHQTILAFKLIKYIIKIMSGPTPPPPAVTITSIVPGNNALTVYYTGGNLPYMSYQADVIGTLFYNGGISPIHIYGPTNGISYSVRVGTYQHISSSGTGPLVPSGITFTPLPNPSQTAGLIISSIPANYNSSVSFASNGQLIVTFDQYINSTNTTRYTITYDDGTNPPIVTNYLTNLQIPATSSGLTLGVPYIVSIQTYSFVAPGTYTLIDTFDLPDTYIPQILNTTVCYTRGTLIGTSRGMIPIEDIKLSDKLRTYDCIKESMFQAVGGIPFKALARVEDTRFKNRFANIKFIGNFKVDIINENTAPICITKNALGENKPERDLLVSPNHSILMGNRLIFAKNLINGSTIYQDMSFKKVEYFHILSDDHYLINANGAMSETLGTEELKLFETMIYAQSQVYQPLASENKYSLTKMTF